MLPLPPKPRLLIIDDIPDNIEVLGGVLDQDYAVQFACSGEEGLALAAAFPPDLILLDVMMPIMDGFSVCRQLKANRITQHIPIVFVTAKNEIEDEGYGLTLGAIDYITKPFHPAIVKSRIKNLVMLKQRSDLLENMAMIDALTHLPNRRRFDETLENEWKRCQREQQPLSLLMMDIDYFKPYNDHYGHSTGDSCLQQVASTLASIINRPADLLARFGGEEFVALLPGTNSNGEGARTLSQRLLQAINQRTIPHDHSAVADHVTLSIGGAMHSPSNAYASPQHLLEAADQQLYHAKAQGRNRFAISGAH
jgi:diguanylate cyclase (GGDEF)-like protein